MNLRAFTPLLAAAPFLALAACSQPSPPKRPQTTPVPTSMPSAAAFQGLNQDQGRCKAALARINIKLSLMPGVRGPGQCGYEWGVLRSATPSQPVWLSKPPATSCAVATALGWWEQQVVAPAARRHLGEAVTAVRHMGSYGCRTIGNRPGGQISEHGRANAIDIAGFKTASGREIRILRDWNGGSTRDKAFLREVHRGACQLFGTVLGPDYNAAHADHLHFDQMARRVSFCR